MKNHLKEFWTDKRVLFIGCMWILYAAIVATGGLGGWTWMWIAAGLAIFFFVEYFIHRFVLHGIFSKLMPKAHQGHDDHHEHPTEMRYLLTPNSYNVPYHIGLWIVFTVLSQSMHTGGAIMLGLATLHLYYEWAHFVSHRAIVPRTKWGKWMKKHHLLHHYKSPEGWYGVTNPAFDKLLGTNRAAAKPEPVRNDKSMPS